MVFVTLLQQSELELVGTIVLDKGGEVIFGVILIVLDFLFDRIEKFFDFLVLLAFAKRVRKDLLLLEFRDEAVENGLSPTDGTGGDSHVAWYWLGLEGYTCFDSGVLVGCAMHVVDVLLAADEDAMTCLEIAFVGVQ
jgi:hypothetical protein